MVRTRSLSLAGFLVGAGIALAPGLVAASPFFAQQTGKDCVACHQPGREIDGKAGLNTMGQAFLQCGFKFDCSGQPVAPPTPRPVPQPHPTPPPQPIAPQPISPPRTPSSPTGNLHPATFHDGCRDDDTYFMVATGAAQPSRVVFALKNNHHITLLLPLTATFSSACGRYPLSSEPKRPVRFD